jgi:hypothetical protein
MGILRFRCEPVVLFPQLLKLLVLLHFSWRRGPKDHTGTIGDNSLFCFN